MIVENSPESFTGIASVAWPLNFGHHRGMSALSRLTILLTTCNGARHLQAQLDSYVAQTHPNWDLWVSDDGSTDDTPAILNRFRDAHGGTHDIRLLTGPRAGSAANFLFLLTHPDLPAQPVALSDQDDVWLRSKLSRALRAVKDAETVTLYGAQSLHTDAELRTIGRSRPPRLPPSFGNALLQNIVSGHSCALSVGALDLVRRAGRPVVPVPYHDWWLYQLITGAGGTVVIDRAVVLLYRQHADNAMGANTGFGAAITRAGQVMGRTYRDWLMANQTALEAVESLLSEDARTLLAAVRAVPRGPGRALALARLGLHRQGRFSDAAFRVAATLGRV